jgi:hypothetical protein
MCFSSKRFATFGKSQKHCSNIELTKIKIQAFKTQLLQLKLFPWATLNRLQE